MDDVVVSPAAVRSLGDLLNALEWWRDGMASFLPVKDLLAFSIASRTTFSVRSVPVQCAHSEGQWDGPYNGDAEFWQRITLPPGTVFVKMRFQWVDQGWGNRKGTFAVLRKGGLFGRDDSGPGDDLLAWVPDFAEHAPTTAELMLDVPRGDGADSFSFDIWLRVGGGGGHQLTISNLLIRALAMVDPSDEVRSAAHSKGEMHESFRALFIRLGRAMISPFLRGSAF